MSDHWILFHQFENYRDYEPLYGLSIGGLGRITFDDETHTAYGLKDRHTGEEVPLTWDEAERMVNA